MRGRSGRRGSRPSSWESAVERRTWRSGRGAPTSSSRRRRPSPPSPSTSKRSSRCSWAVATLSREKPCRDCRTLKAGTFRATCVEAASATEPVTRTTAAKRWLEALGQRTATAWAASKNGGPEPPDFSGCPGPHMPVGETGFEPATPWSRTKCSTRLSHSPMCGANYSMAPALSTRAERRHLSRPLRPAGRRRRPERRSARGRTATPSPAPTAAAARRAPRRWPAPAPPSPRR